MCDAMRSMMLDAELQAYGHVAKVQFWVIQREHDTMAHAVY